MPVARQLCAGSLHQLMEDAGDSVECPECLSRFSTFTTQRNRERTHPIVPSHLADRAGQLKVATARLKRGSSTTPRPY
jgi:hypothetical protein